MWIVFAGTFKYNGPYKVDIMILSQSFNKKKMFFFYK